MSLENLLLCYGSLTIIQNVLSAKGRTIGGLFSMLKSKKKTTFFVISITFFLFVIIVQFFFVVHAHNEKRENKKYNSMQSMSVCKKEKEKEKNTFQ